MLTKFNLFSKWLWCLLEWSCVGNFVLLNILDKTFVCLKIQRTDTDSGEDSTTVPFESKEPQSRIVCSDGNKSKVAYQTFFFRKGISEFMDIPLVG